MRANELLAKPRRPKAKKPAVVPPRDLPARMFCLGLLAMLLVIALRLAHL